MARAAGTRGDRAGGGGGEAPKRARRGGARASREPTLSEEIEASGETPIDEREAAEREIREDLQFLAREFLSWLVYYAEADGGSFEGEEDVPAFTVAFGGKLSLRSP